MDYQKRYAYKSYKDGYLKTINTFIVSCLNILLMNLYIFRFFIHCIHYDYDGSPNVELSYIVVGGLLHKSLLYEVLPDVLLAYYIFKQVYIQWKEY